VLGKYYAKKLIIDHYNYLHANGIRGYIIHIPPNMFLSQCIKFIKSFLEELEPNPDVKFPLPVIYFEHIPSEFYSIAANMNKFALRLKQIKTRIPLGICIDTCHVYVSGIDLGVLSTMKLYLQDLNLQGIKTLFHLNDSIFELGSYRDQHALLGYRIWKESKDSLSYLVNYLHENNIDAIIELKDYDSSLKLVQKLLA
jgi:endonuclease IV